MQDNVIPLHLAIQTLVHRELMAWHLAKVRGALNCLTTEELLRVSLRVHKKASK